MGVLDGGSIIKSSLRKIVSILISLLSLNCMKQVLKRKKVLKIGAGTTLSSLLTLLQEAEEKEGEELKSEFQRTETYCGEDWKPPCSKYRKCGGKFDDGFEEQLSF